MSGFLSFEAERALNENNPQLLDAPAVVVQGATPFEGTERIYRRGSRASTLNNVEGAGTFSGHPPHFIEDMDNSHQIRHQGSRRQSAFTIEGMSPFAGSIAYSPQPYHQSAGGPVAFEDSTQYVDDDSRWAHAHTSPTGLDFFHPEPSYQSAGSSSLLGNFMSSVSYDVEGLTSTASYSLAPSSRRGSFEPLGSHSRSPSPQPGDLSNYGYLNPDRRTWRCAYPGCASKALFVRPCDLRKHFNRHSKDFHCRHEGCPQATEGGFSSKKDRARHEAKHNPGVECEWEGCERIFSRKDNMLDHVKRIHRKGA